MICRFSEVILGLIDIYYGNMNKRILKIVYLCNINNENIK